MIKKIIMAAGLLFGATTGWAAGGDVHLEHMSPDMKDTVSLQNGLRTYMDYCAGCHSLGYARYNRVARDLDIPEDIFMENIVFAEDAKFGDLMKFAMSAENGKAWFGSAPPDLTMVTRVRGVDWVYSYLLGFYKDETRPYGVNNAVFKDVGMPHVLMDLQGLCSSAPHPAEDAKIDPLTGESIHSDACAGYSVEGELTSHEYEEVVYNLVNFLNYMGEPYQMDRKRIGLYVFAFLAVFFFVSLLLQKELFKDIKH
ncbi:cytochrome c1 [Reinekea marinisedimentorum]|uniref:Ubiquinol-cytochrome c reductase cytochrome c1 subunit n=1 Tax=Reinekea marinisedimentorum TaxID=230495 RepID=A0A4R3HXM0_9GAMM|nr:cytochrome c1 [Reinekea marinisedimentorum]TCS36179.1 ubiquinol-cytochrome c reductase cytochrome c1 subunit [Reinekea marinisedimentorum]